MSPPKPGSKPGKIKLSAAELERQFTQAALWYRSGDLERAAAAFRVLAFEVPASAEIHNHLGMVLYDQRRLVAAEQEFHRAVTLKEDYPKAWVNLGNARLAQHRPADALAAFDRAATLAPHLSQVHANRGSAFLRLEQEEQAADGGRADLGDLLEQAEASFRRALELDPDRIDTLINLGVVLSTRHRLEESLAVYRKALALTPDLPELHHNYAMVLIQSRRFREGWREYEWRWKTRRTSANRPMSHRPRWQGEPLEGRTVLFCSEQGFGDTIQFVRYAPLIAERGGRVILRVQRPLIRLLAGLDGISGIVGRGDPEPPHDCHLPMMSAPMVFATEWETVPAAIPYLAADPARAEAWRERLSALAPLRVGLVWSGEPRLTDHEMATTNRRRSIAPERFAPLAAVPGVALVGLQFGTAAQAAGQAPFPIFDAMAGVSDFADTAAIVAALDLVVSVDTSVAHLAGAMGKPVWILSRYDGCWRWPPDREDSPWYPTARIFHQESPGDWTGVIARIRDALAELADR